MKTAKKINLNSVLNGGIANQTTLHGSNLNSTQAQQQNPLGGGNISNSKPGTSVGTSGAKGLFAAGKGMISPGSALMHAGSINGALKDFGGPAVLYSGDGDFSNLPNAGSVPFQNSIGFSQETPIIVLSSEFLPITGTISANDRDFALNVKEQSVLLTAKNATLILSREDSTKALIEKHRQENIALIKKLNDKAFILLKTLADADEALDIKLFSHVPRAYLSLSPSTVPSGLFGGFGSAGSGGSTNIIVPASGPNLAKLATDNKNFLKSVFIDFSKYLEELGFSASHAKNLAPTALYQQFLLELKRSLHMLPRTIVSAPTSGNAIFAYVDDVSKKYNLRGLYKFDDALIQIKPIDDVDFKDPAKFFDSYNIVNKISVTAFDDMFKIKEYYRSPHVYPMALSDLLKTRKIGNSSGPPNPNEAGMFSILSDLYDVTADFALPAPATVSLRHFVFDDTIMKYLQDPRGVYMFTKEVNFSKSLKAPAIQKSLQQNLGYIVSLIADRSIITSPHLATNTLVWDYLLGSHESFKRSVLDTSAASMQQFGLDATINNPENQIQERSLLGLSRANARASVANVDDVITTQYSVLTFEKGDLPLIDDSQYGLTAGAYYYVDSSLFTTDFEKFDSSRVDLLLNYLSRAKENVTLMKSIYSGKTTPTNMPIHKMIEDTNKDDPYLKAVKKLDPWLMGAYRDTLEVSGPTVAIDNKKKRDLMYTTSGLQWQAASIMAATIFKHAIVNKNMKCLRLLFQIVMRETYKRLYSDFSVEYDQFATKIGGVQETKKYSETEYEYNEGDVTPDEADYATISYLEPEIAGIGRMSWLNFKDWATTLIGPNGNANTPELALDAILLTEVGMQALPRSLNISAAPPDYLVLEQCANIGQQTVVGLNEEGSEYIAGKGVVPQFESSETDLLADALFIAGFVIAAAGGAAAGIVAAGPLAAAAAGAIGGANSAFGAGANDSGGPFTTTINTTDFQVGRDVITIADNPVIKRMYIDGKSFIELLGTGLNAEEPFALFKPIVELMIEFFRLEIFKPITGTAATDTPLFDASSQQTENTGGTVVAANIGLQGEAGCTLYSAIPKPIMLWKYFLCICQIISQMTPDNFGGFFTFTEPETNTGGYRLAPLSSETVSSYFSAKSSNVNTIYSKRIDDFVKNYKNLQLKQANMIDIIDQFINNAQKKFQLFKSQLSKDFVPYIQETKSAIDQDRSLTTKQKISLANLSYTADQLILSAHTLSELSDRIDANNTSESKLKSLPSFTDFPKGFIDFYPINDFDTVSCGILSKFFKTQDFNTYFGGNKKIICVGLPPTMMRNLMGLPVTPRKSSSKTVDFKKSIVQINLYKNDVLHPGIIFKPRVYCFEARRFPTRIVSNWSNLNNWQSYKDTPSKFYDGKDFVLHQDFADAKQLLYKDTLGTSTNALISPDQLYYNFFQSFAAEQYIKWFSRFSVDESRYFNFSGLDSELKTLTEQFDNYVKSTGAVFNANNLIGASTAATQGIDITAATSNLGNAVQMHLRNESLLLSPSTIKQRILFTKKFDRVFNIMFDPDDFEIDTVDANLADKYVQEGIITKDGNTYAWNRQTQQSDFSFDEYWVTIEPFYSPIALGGKFSSSISKYF